MKSSELLSQVTDLNAIQGYLDWHIKQGLAVVLMMASCDVHVRARLTDCDADGLMAVCTGVRGVEQGPPEAYSMIGTSARGANFLASGEIQPISGTADCFKLSFPERLDISQSRDSYRCTAPASSFLHFSLPHCHQNDVVCKVHDVSLGGMAIEWDSGESRTVPSPGTILEHAILVASDNSIKLNKLRVAHVTHRNNHAVLGLQFERDVPRQYGSLVLSAQRSHYFA